MSKVCLDAAAFDETKSDAKSIFNLLFNVGWFVFSNSELTAP